MDEARKLNKRLVFLLARAKRVSLSTTRFSSRERIWFAVSCMLEDGVVASAADLLHWQIWLI
jgi:hypothetical protein